MIAMKPLMHKEDYTEEELVMQAKGGSHPAFEALYRMHLRRVYGICMRILADRSRAEEATQKIFIQAWIKLRSFRGEGRFASWLYRLSVNMIFDELRLIQTKRKAESEGEAMETVMASGPESIRNLRLDINSAIDSLPRQARIIFMMHDVAGFTHEEIAEAMRLAAGTRKTQLSRARGILREALKR
jgi:RNA polymerase sigma factor (sigma-70 family)